MGRTRRALQYGLGAVAAVALAAGGAVVVDAAPAGAVPGHDVVFNTPGLGSFDVPAGVCFVTITADGGHGGAGTGTGGVTMPGGAGVMVTGRVATSPGATFEVLVAGGGGASAQGGVGGFGGGAGGGLTGPSVRTGGGGGASVVTTAGVPQVVAGGGGGGGVGSPGAGGAGGLLGADGATGATGGGGGGGTSAGTGGTGGTAGSGSDAGGGGGGVAAAGSAGDASAGNGGNGNSGVGGGGGGGGYDGGPTQVAGGPGGGGGTGSGAGGTGAGAGGSGNDAGGDGGGGGGTGVLNFGGGGGGGGVGFAGAGAGAQAAGGGGGGYGAAGGGAVLAGGGGGSSFVAPGATNVSSALSMLPGDGQVAFDLDVDSCTNQPPVCTGATQSVSTLWPPNHRLVPVTVNGVTDPDGDPVTITITSIVQDEPTSGVTTGDLTPDGFGIGTGTAMVRAERADAGNGRVYHIGFSADDGHGGTCTGVVLVGVPHDLGKGKVPINDGALYDSTM